MQGIVCRTIMGLGGVIAVARRPLELPFVPPAGTILVYGEWMVRVQSVELDVEARRVVVHDADDRTLARLDVSPAEVDGRLNAYRDGGWSVNRLFDWASRE